MGNKQCGLKIQKRKKKQFSRSWFLVVGALWWGWIRALCCFPGEEACLGLQLMELDPCLSGGAVQCLVQGLEVSVGSVSLGCPSGWGSVRHVYVCSVSKQPPQRKPATGPCVSRIFRWCCSPFLTLHCRLKLAR